MFSLLEIQKDRTDAITHGNHGSPDNHARRPALSVAENNVHRQPSTHCPHAKCTPCEQDILTRTHTAVARERLAIAERYISGWLHQWTDTDYSLCEATPHPNGLEQSVSGLTEAYLARVEASWKSGASTSPPPSPSMH
jgi:hypothetical protein